MNKCQIPDCPEQTGGTCFTRMTGAEKEVVRELRATRNVYRQFEQDDMQWVEKPGWKVIINVLDDRIEQIAGTRV